MVRHGGPVSLLLVTCLLIGCATEVAREATEQGAKSRVGRTPVQAFKDIIGVECGMRGGEDGCMHTDGRDCRIWYTVDRTQGVITGWRYAGPQENCLRMRHGG